MSVLNQSGEEQVECPLCMEPLEVDDLHFYPCTCGYQICRFCWHRIRTDENGLCPACRKAYSENPADFIPLSKEQVAQLKAEKRQRDQQRKAKLTENRKHLASVRVVQRNLVFVVGLPMRLADPEVLKKYEYFGKFGKIHKVVINQSTSYAGTQGPSASAYVTYMKSDDALRAIQNVNNTIMDGKTIKTSLGTTKYCSHFMKNQSCPKPDCMYLHDFGDQEASFTKEQMHAGKHQDYEKKLHEVLLSKLAAQTTAPTPTPPTTTNTTTITNGGANGGGEPKKSSTKESVISSSSTTSTNSTVSTSSAADKTKDNWPQLNQNETKTEKKPDKAEKDKKKNKAKSAPKLEKKSPPPPEPKPEEKPTEEEPPQPEATPPATISPSEPPQQQPQQSHPPMPPIHKLNPHQIVDDNTSFFSQNTFSKLPDDSNPLDTTAHQLNHHHIPMPQSDGLLDINDTDSWDFDFGYEKHSSHLEELAKQRITVNDMLETFTGLEQYPKIDNPTPSYPTMVDNYDTENLLETLAKNSVNYQNTVHNPTPPPQQSGHYMNGHKELNNLDQHMSKFFSDFYRNGYKQQLSPNLHNIPLRDNIHPLNGYHQFPQQQQQLSQQHQLDRIEKNRMVLLQQRLQIEEQLLNLGLDRNKHSFGQLNGHYDPMQNGGSGNFGNYLGGQLSSAGGGGNTMNAGKNRSLLEDKDLDYRFQEAQKALEELVESDSHMHNTGRSRGGGSAIGMGSANQQQQQGQLNGLVHSQSGGHLPPPPPGFVQPTTTHMNSFGSKILPYLNMNSQQQLNNTQQNSWPTNFTQQQQQQNQQHKGVLGMDWKVLDPAILSSRRHIPNMPPLLDQYGSGNSNGLQQQLQQQNQQMSNNGSSAVGSNMRSPFDSYNSSFYHHPIQSYGNYAHLSSPTAASAAVQNLNWLGNEINTQISSPPGFRTSGQATKQQEC